MCTYNIAETRHHCCSPTQLFKKFQKAQYVSGLSIAKACLVIVAVA